MIRKYLYLSFASKMSWNRKRFHFSSAAKPGNGTISKTGAIEVIGYLVMAFVDI